MEIRKIYEACQHRWYGRRMVKWLRSLYSRDPFRRKLKILNRGSLNIKKSIIGKSNILLVKNNACIDKSIIKIIGSNNKIYIGENTIIGEGCKIYLFGNNLRLFIGKNSSFSHDDELLVQENGCRIIIGDECMFSHHINIRTSDAHPIIDIHTGLRTNPAKNISIGTHVWVGANVIIQKGAKIGNNCVVGTNSIVNSRILNKSGIVDNSPNDNVIIAGIPAKIVKEGINWRDSFS